MPPRARHVPRWERRLAVALRIAVVATAVAHLARGELLLAGYSLLALAVIVTPPLVARSSGANVPIELELALLALLVTDITLGQLFGWYHQIAFWDKGLHLGNSILLGFLGFVTLYVLLSTGGLRVSAPLALHREAP